MYYRGLKDYVKDELVRLKVDYMLGLDNLAKESIDINNRLYERSIEKRHLGLYRGRTSITSNG